MNRKDSLKQRAYDHIREKLMSGALIGGSRISDAELAEEIGISRTPVREAIIQLETEGVIEQIPRFGSFIRMLTREELIHLYEVREVLEGHAAEQAALKATPEQVRQLEAYNQEMLTGSERVRDERLGSFADNPAGTQILTADIAFHMLLTEIAGNPWIAKILSDTRVVSRLVGHRKDQPREELVKEMARACREHRKIAKAIAGRDGKAARAAIVEHIRGARDLRLTWFDKQQASGTSGGERGAIPAPVRRAMSR